MRKHWLLLLLATLSVTVQTDVYAQQQKKEKYRNKANDPVAKLPYYKKLRWTDELFRAGSYFNAIEYYHQLLQEQERNPYLVYQLAECYWYTRDYVPAAEMYGYAYALAPKVYPEAIYKQALMLKMQGEYDAAMEAFNKFIADNPKSYKGLKKRAQREIDGCVMAKNSINDPVAVNVVNAGPNVNSAYTELSPYPLGDTALLFSSMVQNTVVEVDKKKREEYVSRFLVSKKFSRVEQVDSFQWALKFEDGKFNNPKAHVGNGVYSPGGDRFYFTRCMEEDSMQMMCKIYVSKFEKAAWSEPKLLGDGINDGGSNTHPFVAKVGKKEVLFFSSNRQMQSRGGYDIWYSIIDPRSGTYRRPQNAGKTINTEGDEVTPYYDSRENKLYFASNGWVTMGGFDIFSADGGPSRYTNLQNLGYPINTSADEMYYIRDPLGKPDAYVVSNRVGSVALKNPTCCDDIWRIQYEPKLVVVGKVINSNTGAKLEEVVVKMVDEQGNEKTYNSADGDFSFNMQRGHSYVFTGDKYRFSTHRATVSTMGIQRTDPDQTVNITIYMDTIGLDGSFRVSNIFYDFDKATLRPESVASLDTLINFLNDNPALSVEIYSFTDGKGSEEYNKELSQRRAQAVLSYLEQAGIPVDRLTAKGLGKAHPVAPNQVNGKDNPEGRQSNRRTELRIVAEDPNRHVIFNSARLGTLGEQQKNLQINEDKYNYDGSETDSESDFGRPGSRVNR
jgi:outer membrane protein OmpA-like peptidoglycan-associated protein